MSTAPLSRKTLHITAAAVPLAGWTLHLWNAGWRTARRLVIWPACHELAAAFGGFLDPPLPRSTDVNRFPRADVMGGVAVLNDAGPISMFCPGRLWTGEPGLA